MTDSRYNRDLGILRTLWMFRKSSIIVFTPIILLPLPLVGGTQVADCIYIMCLMGIYWATEACPLAVTSLLPAVLCPLFGVQDANTTASNYFNHVTLLLIGTLVMCIAIEESGLHRRVALKALLFFGSEPCWLLLGLMSITAFLSMWLMNMSTLSLMLPITIGVCNEMDKATRDKELSSRLVTLKDGCEESNAHAIYLEDHSANDDDVQGSHKDDEIKIHKMNEECPKSYSKFQKPMLLGICYASSIGGISTAVGTPTNIAGIGIFHDRFNDSSVNFGTWLSFGFPISIIGLLITWLWIMVRFLDIREFVRRKKRNSSNKAGTMMRKLNNDLPEMSFAEKSVGVHFLVLIALWIFRDPKMFPGWSNLFPSNYVNDSTVAVVVGLSIFLFPSQSSSFKWMWRRKLGEFPPSPAPSLLSWKTFQAKCPWDITLLVGSGFAIAGACVDSGLSEATGNALTGIYEAPTWVIILAISSLTSITTEFASNTAMVSMLLPIVLPIAEEVGMSPIPILLAVTLSGSFAFALPIATPCNALVYSSGAVTIPDMLWTGIPLNFIFIALLNLFLSTYGPLIFNFEPITNGTTNVTPMTLENGTSLQ